MIGLLVTLAIVAAIVVVMRSRGMLGPSKAQREMAGKMALEAQPDRISLSPRIGSGWQDEKKMSALVSPLVFNGFSDIGTYGIREMMGVRVRFFVNVADNSAACVYEHSKAGYWVDLYSRYADGGSFTCSNSKPTGLVERQGHRIVHAPGLDSNQLIAKFRAERPKAPFEPVDPEKVPEQFEKTYADSIASRKARGGLSADEVARAAANYGR